jgi:hypothetical protein
VTSAAHADGPMLPKLVNTDNTPSEVWADSAYGSQKNEKWLASRMLFIRTIGIARAEAKLTLANIAYNFDRLIFHARAGTLG